MANLSLPEIFVQLPEDVQSALIVALEESNISNITSEEVFSAAEKISKTLKRDYPESSELIDQVPQAVVDTLF